MRKRESERDRFYVNDESEIGEDGKERYINIVKRESGK